MARERVHATYHTTPSTGDGYPPPPLLRKNATQSNTFSEYESASRPARGGCVIFSLLVVAGLLRSSHVSRLADKFRGFGHL